MRHTAALRMALLSHGNHHGSIDKFLHQRKMTVAGLTQEPSLTGWCRRGNRIPVSGECMNKADLVDRIAGACGISKVQATTAIDTAVDSVTAALRKGDRVALIGFGTFSVSQRKARNGRNPQTAGTIKIAARRVAKFSPGNEPERVSNRGKQGP